MKFIPHLKTKRWWHCFLRPLHYKKALFFQKEFDELKINRKIMDDQKDTILKMKEVSLLFLRRQSLTSFFFITTWFKRSTWFNLFVFVFFSKYSVKWIFRSIILMIDSPSLWLLYHGTDSWTQTCWQKLNLTWKLFLPSFFFAPGPKGEGLGAAEAANRISRAAEGTGGHVAATDRSDR